jgi:hypothetical protein
VSETLKALAVTSDGAPPSAVTPVIAALEAAGLDVRAVDVGRAGSREEGTVGRFVRAIAGEFAERRLDRQLSDDPVDVAIAFDPATVGSLTAIRDTSGRPTPVLAVVADLAPATGWAGTNADRYLVVDDEAAVALADKGIDGARVMPVGPVACMAYVAAAGRSRQDLRKRFKVGAGPVVLIRVEGFGYELTQQIALQLSLIGASATYLFDAGSDTEAASALRRQVPTLGLKAKLFGTTNEAASYWRAADVVVARPEAGLVAQALILGCRFVSLLDDEKRGERLASALARRKLGATAASPLLLSSALEGLLGSGEAPLAGVDGAGNIADIAYVVGGDRDAVVADNRSASHAQVRSRVEQAASFAEAQSKASSAAGDLEDLSGGGGFEDFGAPVDQGEVSSLRADIEKRMAQTGAIVTDARKRAENADKLAAAKRKAGDSDGAAAASKTADAERKRMHTALAEMAELQTELDTLASAASAAPPRGQSQGPRPAEPQVRPSRGSGTSTRKPRQSVDDMLEQLKREAGSGQGGRSRSRSNPKGSRPRGSQSQQSGSSVDDELAALKRKMQNQKRKK